MLKTPKTQNETYIEKFQNAEQLWFWFLYSKSIQNGFRGNHSVIQRVCELIDVETLITKLYLSGQLTEEQLKIMKIFGDKRRAPHQHIFKENKSAALWNAAMSTLEKHAREKGWLND